jgi:hypothetical protein
VQLRPSIPALLICVAVASTPGADAQTPAATARLEVQVEIASGDQRIPWEGVEIVVVDPGTRTILSTRSTDAEGRVVFPPVQTSTYQVSLELPNGARETQSVRVTAQGATVRFDISVSVDAASAFRRAVKDMESRDPQRRQAAERALRYAIAASGGFSETLWVRLYGMRFEQLMPHYYLGILLTERGDWCGASRELTSATKEAAGSSRLARLSALIGGRCTVGDAINPSIQLADGEVIAPVCGSPDAERFRQLLEAAMGDLDVGLAPRTISLPANICVPAFASPQALRDGAPLVI